MGTIFHRRHYMFIKSMFTATRGLYSWGYLWRGTSCKHPNILYIKGAAFEQTWPLILAFNLTIQMIVFTSIYERYMEQTIKTKHDKHDPLIEGIRAQGWNVNPLIVILLGERGAIHSRSINLLCKPSHSPI